MTKKISGIALLAGTANLLPLVYGANYEVNNRFVLLTIFLVLTPAIVYFVHRHSSFPWAQALSTIPALTFYIYSLKAMFSSMKEFEYIHDAMMTYVLPITAAANIIVVLCMLVILFSFILKDLKPKSDPLNLKDKL